MGTVSYMSPEQAQGLDVDDRTDLWSTGVLIYEMVAGCVPFSGVTRSHTIVDILEKEPAPLANLGARRVPAELQRIVSKALAKKRDERYQTAKDMLIDLRNLKKRLELDVEMERSRAPESIASLAATGNDAIRGTGSLAVRRSTAQEKESKTRVRRQLITGLAIVLVLAAGLIVARNWSRFRSSSATGPAPASVAERQLSYWMTVQKYRNGRPFEDPFRLAGEINFEKDYRVRLDVSSPQSGYLYILNEGPATGDGSSSFVILFPSTSSNGGLSQLAENQRIEIPERSWFAFDAEKGTEKLWVVFAASAVPELEAVKPFANLNEKGLVKDAGLSARVQEFLRAHAGAKTTIEKDEELKQTSLKIPGTVLVHVIALEHH
jgi:serine/threonine protein kinase